MASMTPIQPLAGISAVTAGPWQSLAFRADGSLWAWGANDSGQLGDGTVGSYRISPVPVSGFGPLLDFLVTDIVLTPGAPAANGTFSADIMVTNAGTISGSPGTLQVWTNQASWQNCGALGDQALNLPNLAAGESQAVTLTGLLSGQTGVKTLRTFVESRCLLKEIDDTNNQTTTSYTVPGPDFRVTDILLTPDNPSAGKTFGAAITVTNQGTLDGSPGTLQVWTNQASQRPCGALGNQSVTLADLAAGASVTVNVDDLPAGGLGAKTLRAFVDSQCLTREVNETNNQGTRAYSVLAPDFVVTQVNLIPASPSANGIFSVEVTVKNQGTTAGVPGLVQVWANQTKAQVCGALGDRNGALSSLAVGESRTVTIGNLPSGTPGAKTLRVFVDSQCQSTETNDNNNQTTLAYNTLAATPDFVVSKVVLTPASPTANGTFSANITVKNQGTLAGVPGKLQVWANQATNRACNAIGNKAVTLASLGAGASRTVTVTGLQAGRAGNKTLRAFVDSQCQTTEVDDGNNQTTQAYSVLASPAPDFVVTGIELTPASPKADGTFSARISVKNQGVGSGNGGYLDVWAHEATAQTCYADGDAYASVGILAPGATKTLTISGLPAGAAADRG